MGEVHLYERHGCKQCEETLLLTTASIIQYKDTTCKKSLKDLSLAAV